MTTYYGVSAPLGSGKTTAAIEYAGYQTRAGEKVAIAQPSVNLIDQSVRQARERWPNTQIHAIHSERVPNVSQVLGSHLKQSSGGEMLFVTHSGLLGLPYWSRKQDWHLIIDEALDVVFSIELTLPVNYGVLLPALKAVSYNARYSALEPGNAVLLEAIAENKGYDQIYEPLREVARRLSSGKWRMFVLSEQWERFLGGAITDGKLLIFGLLDPAIFEAFASVTFMSANLERTIAYQHLSANRIRFKAQNHIVKRLRFTEHQNGNLLTIHYALEDGHWSKRRRDKEITVEEMTVTVNDLITTGAMAVFGDNPFVWLANKDIEDEEPFDGRGQKLPHSSHGLNSFQHFHNAAVLAALNPSPAFYAFLDEIGLLNPDDVRRAIYHEAVYQSAGRISTRNPADLTPKNLVVADRAAAEAIAHLYPGADVVPLPLSHLVSQSGQPGRKAIHSSDAERKRAYRERHIADLIQQLDDLNKTASETKSPKCTGIFVSDGAVLGGSLFQDVYRRRPAEFVGGDISASEFFDFLRGLHSRSVAKADAWLWSPAEFVERPDVDTGRGLANIAAIHGVFLDNDGGELPPEEFAALFPHLMMVIHNSASSTPDRRKWRAIIPTTCPMTIDVHREIMLQIRQALNRRGYYDRDQLAKREKKGKRDANDKDHGFDPSKYTSSSLFYLPAQAEAGPQASFFLTYDDARRGPINPYQWISRSILNPKPEPEPELKLASLVVPNPTRKDPKLIDALAALEADGHAAASARRLERIEKAFGDWRIHQKGTGNAEFFRLGARLANAGMEMGEIRATLFSAAAFAHGSKSQADRRSQISHIMRRITQRHR